MNSAQIDPVMLNSITSQLGFKWDVMILTNGCYAGIGRLCKTLADAIRYCHEYNCKDIRYWDRNRTRLVGLYDEYPPYIAWWDRTPLTYEWSL